MVKKRGESRFSGHRRPSGPVLCSSESTSSCFFVSTPSAYFSSLSLSSLSTPHDKTFCILSLSLSPYLTLFVSLFPSLSLSGALSPLSLFSSCLIGDAVSCHGDQADREPRSSIRCQPLLLVLVPLVKKAVGCEPRQRDRCV